MRACVGIGRNSIENDGVDRYTVKRNGVILDWFTFDGMDPADYSSAICAISCSWMDVAQITPAIEKYSIGFI